MHERLLTLPEARGLDGLPMATGQAAPQPALEGYTFEGYRNADGSVGTRNILAITQTVQCVAGVTDFAVRRIKADLLPRFAHVDDVVALEHSYGWMDTSRETSMTALPSALSRSRLMTTPKHVGSACPMLDIARRTGSCAR